ncbi:MAG: MarR family transcriptional regulator [Thermoplasmata archaeon]
MDDSVPHRRALEDEALAELRRAFSRIAFVTTHSTRHGQLHLAHHLALHPLFARRAATQKEIGDAIGLTSGRMTGLIDELEAMGAVRRERSPDDRRKMWIHLTVHGRQLHDEIHEGFLRSGTEIFKGMSDEDLETLQRLLLRLAAGANEVDTDRLRQVQLGWLNRSRAPGRARRHPASS